jgi:hypothetical protein
MRRRWHRQATQLVLTLALAALGSAHAGARWEHPYKGKDLSGWHVQNGKAGSWKADGEAIACVAPGGGFLTLDRQYSDFELRLEYRIPPGGNSGIGIRYPPGGHPSSTGIEVQILDDPAAQYKDLKPAQYNGSLYKLVAPRKKVPAPPGQWNRLEIRCKGPAIRVRVNGETLIDVNADQHTETLGDLTSLAKRPRSGCIGLQSHGDPVQFRKIEIREL